MEDRREYEVFEVFVRKKKTDAHVHVGSLNAPSPDIALTTARENFLRREKAVNLWVVPQGEIYETPRDEGDWFARELDRKYREVSGYSENGRLWKKYRERALHLEEIVQDLHQPLRGNSQRPRREGT